MPTSRAPRGTRVALRLPESLPVLLSFPPSVKEAPERIPLTPRHVGGLRPAYCFLLADTLAWQRDERRRHLTRCILGMHHAIWAVLRVAKSDFAQLEAAL